MNICLMRFGAVVESEGGTEKVLCNMANEFVERGHNMSIICCEKKQGKPFFPLSDKVKFINLNDTGKEIKSHPLLRVKREILKVCGKLDKTERDKIFIKSRYDNNYIKNRFTKIMNEMQPDIVIAHDYLSLIFLKYLMKNKIPCIAVIHNDPIRYFNNDFSEVQIDAFNSADCIQSLIKSREKIIRKYCPSIMLKFIPNPVTIIEKRKNNKTYLKLINVATISKNIKQQHIIIEAFNKIKNDFSQWNIEFVGGTKTPREVEYKKEMLDYVQKNNLQKNICFSGVTTNVVEKLQKADIFVFPSKSEAFGLALTEAMAAGLPAIGFKSCPAVNEIIINGYNGFLCEDGVDDFADKMKILMQDEKLRKQMGENARKSMDRFAPEKIWNQWEILIKEVIDVRKNN